MGIGASSDFGYGFVTEDFATDKSIKLPKSEELVKTLNEVFESRSINCFAIVYGYFEDYEEIAVFHKSHYVGSVAPKPSVVDRSLKVSDDVCKEIERAMEVFFEVIRMSGVVEEDFPEIDPDWYLLANLVP